jgi:hypothetical protein
MRLVSDPDPLRCPVFRLNAESGPGAAEWNLQFEAQRPPLLRMPAVQQPENSAGVLPTGSMPSSSNFGRASAELHSQVFTLAVAQVL